MAATVPALEQQQQTPTSASWNISKGRLALLDASEGDTFRESWDTAAYRRSRVDSERASVTDGRRASSKPRADYHPQNVMPKTHLEDDDTNKNPSPLNPDRCNMRNPIKPVIDGTGTNNMPEDPLGGATMSITSKTGNPLRPARQRMRFRQTFATHELTASLSTHPEQDPNDAHQDHESIQSSQTTKNRSADPTLLRKLDTELIHENTSNQYTTDDEWAQSDDSQRSDKGTNLREIDLYGTSTPSAGFFTPNSLRSHGRSYLRGSQGAEVASYGPLQSFATARSSLASYATAASGPRGLWMNQRFPSITQRNATANHDQAETYDVEASRRSFKSLGSLMEAISHRIIEDRFGIQVHGMSYSNSITDGEELCSRSHGDITHIWQHLLPLLPQSHVFLSLDSVVRKVAREVRSFLQEQHNSGWSGSRDSLDLDCDVAMLIYEYASTESHLRDLVPVRPLEHSKSFSSEWLIHLNTRGLIVDESIALDWSGRGQHVEFSADEERSIPLEEKHILGYSATAIVQAVRCRRILLARKTIRCNRRLTKEVAVTEVEHLQRLSHRHIIRLVGTYTCKRNLAILLYPVAQWNLEEYLDELVELFTVSPKINLQPLLAFPGCLSNALRFLHDHNVKHMDIKPGNLLIRDTKQGHRIYVADFGIARAYKSAEESCTDSPTAFTPVYAAPEVVMQERRGFPADVFSLGCVFMEIFAVLVSTPAFNERTNLIDIRASHSDKSYQTCRVAVMQWYNKVRERIHDAIYSNVNFDSLDSANPGWAHSLVESMLSSYPALRPTAQELAEAWRRWECGNCGIGAEPFEAFDPKSPTSKISNLILL